MMTEDLIKIKCIHKSQQVISCLLHSLNLHAMLYLQSHMFNLLCVKSTDMIL